MSKEYQSQFKKLSVEELINKRNSYKSKLDELVRETSEKALVIEHGYDPKEEDDYLNEFFSLRQKIGVIENYIRSSKALKNRKCSNCAKLIETERLEIMPYTPYCSTCAASRQK